MMKRCGLQALQLIFTDTDSLTYHIQTEDVYKDILESSDVYDTSNCPRNHPNYSHINCKIVGKFKDENAAVASIKFVGLRAKIYSILLNENISKSTAKVIKTSYSRKYLTHQSYRDCLMKETESSATFYTIENSNHQLCTKKITKAALCPFDDKRYILKNSTDCYSVLESIKINEINDLSNINCKVNIN